MRNTLVIEPYGGDIFTFDIYSRLLKDRIIFLGDVNREDEDGYLDSIVGQLIYLASVDSSKEIQVYINSSGGFVSNFFALYDTIRFIKPAVRTVCFGRAYSAAALILAAGNKGMRYALANSRVMLHLPSGGVCGDANQIENYSREVSRIKSTFVNLLSKHTGRSEDSILEDLKQDLYLTSYEAKEYGLIDHVINADKELLTF